MTRSHKQHILHEANDHFPNEESCEEDIYIKLLEYDNNTQTFATTSESNTWSRMLVKLREIIRNGVATPRRARKTTRKEIVSRFVYQCCSMFLACRPRYLLWNGINSAKKASSTTYLDSLRGWAAVFVVIKHLNPMEKATIYGRAVSQFPLIPLISNGGAMTDIFFVISGYVLTIGILRMIHQRKNKAAVLDHLASSVSRRYLRLYGAIGMASFIARVLWCLQITGIHNETWRNEMSIWFFQFIEFCDPITPLITTYWYPHVHNDRFVIVAWTIPVEFRGSVAVWLFCLATCRMSVKSRMLSTILIMVMSYYWTAIYMALFFGGMLIAELSLIRQSESTRPHEILPIQDSEEAITKHKHSKLLKVMCVIGLVISLLLLGQPATNKEQFIESYWPWPQLAALLPETGPDELMIHYHLSIGALLLVFVLDTYPTLQAPLHWRFSRYLGDLSFGIYVMHVPVIDALWRPILRPSHDQWCGPKFWTYMPFALAFSLAVLWAADLFARLDDYYVASLRTLEKKTHVW